VADTNHRGLRFTHRLDVIIGFNYPGVTTFFFDTATKPSSAGLSGDPSRSAEPLFPTVDAMATALAAIGVQEETGEFLGVLEVFVLLGG
jgi:hypothetical protein